VKRFLELAKQMEHLQSQTEAVRLELNAEMAALGVGAYAQDPATGLVYKIVRPIGTYIHFREIDYVRTAKESERSGSLSKKEAEAAGFKLSR
jgi:hypothetical protein